MDYLGYMCDLTDNAAGQVLDENQQNFASGILTGVNSETFPPVAESDVSWFPVALDTTVLDELCAPSNPIPPPFGAAYESPQELMGLMRSTTEPASHSLRPGPASSTSPGNDASGTYLDIADAHFPSLFVYPYELSRVVDDQGPYHAAVLSIPGSSSQLRPRLDDSSTWLASMLGTTIHAPSQSSQESSSTPVRPLARSRRSHGPGDRRRVTQRHPRISRRTCSGPGSASRANGELARTGFGENVLIAESRRHMCERAVGDGEICGKRFKKAGHLKRHAQVHDHLSVRKKLHCPLAYYFGDWVCPRGGRRPIIDRPDNMPPHCSSHCFGHSVNRSRNTVFHKEVLDAIYAQQLREDNVDDKTIEARQASVGSVVNTPPALRWQMPRCRSGGCTLVIRRLYSADQEAVLGSSDKR